MGRNPRHRPRRLGIKLKQIREALKLSQDQILSHLGLEQLKRTNISNYETGYREPPLYVLLRYARAAGVTIDSLVDDALELPRSLPAQPTSSAVKSGSTRRTTKK